MSFFFQRRFQPLFICQFFGAFNDNLLKSGLSFLVVYQWAQHDPLLSPAHIIQIATAFLVLPFLLFSHKAGSLADFYDKARMARYVKGLEMIIVSITSLAFYWQNTALLLFCVFLMGTQSTFFGPIKYALLPLHLKGKELLVGNAYIESSTFVAILIGSIGGGVLSLFPHSVFLISITVISCAFIGWIASLNIPLQTHKTQKQHDVPLPWRETYRLIAQYPLILSLIIAISWFWFFGALLLSQIPLFTQHHLAGDESLATLFLATLTAGITCGAFSAPPLLKRFCLPHILIVSCIIMGIASLIFSSLAFSTLTPIQSHPYALHGVLAAALFISAWAGGLYSVPLYTQLQKTSPKAILSRCIATNNIVNASLIISSALFALTLIHLDATIQTILILNSLVPLILASYYGIHKIRTTSHPLTSLDERHNM